MDAMVDPDILYNGVHFKVFKDYKCQLIFMGVHFNIYEDIYAWIVNNFPTAMGL